MSVSRWWWVVALGLGVTGCRTTGSAARPEASESGPKQELQFDAVTVTADLELDKLNDEELFAGGTSAFAANDFKQAARYFGRLADFHPNSQHRRSSLYNAGLAHQRLKEWEEAWHRFSELADPAKGQGDALDASFRVAETQYHLERYDEAIAVLTTIAAREDLPANRRIEARVQQGVCELEAGRTDAAEATLRKAISSYEALADKDEVDDYFPAQAHFFMGELYRLHYENVKLDPAKGADKLAEDLNYKAELLLSAQGHYLRSIRVGNGYWATAAGSQIGALYEDLYAQMVSSPAPSELNAEESVVYRQELRKKIRVLLTKSINIYERTLETAERIGSQSAFVDRTRESLAKVKALLLADAEGEPVPAPPASELEPHT
ncbi:tetratricopeptide repeat protein [Myxococcus sp. CA051A]|uniref:Tetratricopeptide repeat protein n=1 Tax=Myxococcus llanfairpwllgwyngyllgogerychwyrndrobwllllantysiliogogogochensis TaxID=2590453 RepID=A0A540WWK9_9BACT|nr:MULTISPECIES: tetratricopeptide repeat protein [Myxococcus]NTX00550.1 tetratricopeptide repeat protein [Myxococcus sp. CA040A]NTX12747.1 tetratricopeptide repeat protein [Myxococcus sp. CA056]NTX33766.1 tetratricopeptide repeat protein [Myxococcus sp. CA033]NTX58076.1 tetratricopeptide repeat protein [Myxococcus sp. CA039A]NTX59127.1 tetratricopeptide repeat protein [Myxococcus sp. CA051A]